MMVAAGKAAQALENYAAKKSSKGKQGRLQGQTAPEPQK
jgi:hypothetical protein